jgi:hypothetical protein
MRISGSTRDLNLTDNSLDTTTITYCDAGRVFQIVSGSNGSAITTANSALGAISAGMTISGSYGLFLPDIGTILLNGSALDLNSAEGLNLQTDTAINSNGANPLKLLKTIQSGSSFGLNSEETVTSDFVFVRARNSEFNYSENPSYISGSTGEVIYSYFINNPQTYPTTIGLYNDTNELLAVAKLSRPLLKDFTKEALVRVKLDF